MRVLKSQQLWPLLDCTRLAVLHFVDLCFFVPFMRTICEVSALPRYEAAYLLYHVPCLGSRPIHVGLPVR